ncbi:MAG TPA: outer membrane beta-barrel protein [Pseudolabrys sp.]|nr:outer membrane beta-barrel protein [Pseudolabrys sp.]
MLLAACLALSSSEARAQSAVVNPDPLAPNLIDPRRQQRFEDNLPPLAQAGQPATTFAPFTVPPPASGAGATGFDSTNARKKSPPKPKTNAASDNAVTPQAAAPPPSPYQTPPPGQDPAQTEEANAAQAAVPPGTPAIQPIEEIRPAKKKKARAEPDDPYAPLGIRAGAFDLFPAFELSGGYSTNPGATPQPKGAWLYSVAPELKVQSDWSRHELKADIHGNYTGFSPDQTPTLSRPFLDGKAEGRVDVTHDTRIDLGGKVLVSTDAPNSPNLQAGLAKLPVFVTYGGEAGLGQRFSRFDVSLKGTAERTVYQDSQLTDGTTASNEDRNYNQYGGKLRGGYEMFPGVTPFAEVDADTRQHDLNTDFFGYQRDSTGVTGKAGSTFEISKVLIGEVALGYTRRDYQDPRLSDVAGLIGDASLIWTATALTSVKLTGSSTVGEVDIPGVSGALYRDVALQVDHAFRRWLIGSVKVGFGLDDYVGLDRTDHRYSVAGGLTYKLDRSWQVKGEVRQDWLRSNNNGNNYNNTTFLLGLRWQK